MTDQVRDALLDSYYHDHGSVSNWIATLAPLVEKAAKAAYVEGWLDRDNVPDRVVKRPQDGVAAFVAVLTEGEK